MATEATARIEIDASLDRVWDVMMDTGAYGAWNPFVVAVDGTPKVGDPLRLRVRWRDGREITSPERVTAIEPPAAVDGARTAAFAYRYDAWLHALGLVRAVRVQRLVQRDGGPTVYETSERFTGLFAGSVPIADVNDGFARHAAALKARAEARP